jgi:hypothetical protein
VANRLGLLAAKHDVELGEAEDESIAPVDQVDQGEVEALGERLGQDRGEFKPAETGAQHDHSHLHGFLLGRRRYRYRLGCGVVRR